MPLYEVITPLRNGGPDPVQPGEIVELDEREAAPLVAVGALSPVVVVLGQSGGQIAQALTSETEAGAPADPAPVDPAPVDPAAVVALLAPNYVSGPDDDPAPVDPAPPVAAPKRSRRKAS